MMDIKQLKEQMQAALLAARGICDEAEQEAREFTADERVKLEGYLKEAGDLKAQIKQVEGDADLRKQIMDLGGLGLATPRDGQMGAQPGRGKSLGEQFVGAKAFQDWMKAIAPGGRIPEGARGLMSPPVEFGSLLGRKTLVTGESDTSAGAFVETDYTGIYEPLGRRERTLLDLIPRRTTTSDLVHFVRQTAKVTQATPVAEANVTTYAGSTGEVSGEKPEGAMAFVAVTEAVKTIAVWVPATKRALSDVAQLRGIIDGELREDVQEELEDQVADGNGTGENFTGILNTSGILEQAWDTDLFTTARKAKTYLRTTGRVRPTAWVLNPEDWETIELTQDGDNRYYYGGPIANGEPRLWGVPVVESEAIDQGVAILGDFRKAVIWDRERTTIQISDSHEDFFIRNMIAILAEMRAAFGVIRPSAFCLVELESGS
jgi:HK97 family phage major capsid protein